MLDLKSIALYYLEELIVRVEKLSLFQFTAFDAIGGC